MRMAWCSAVMLSFFAYACWMDATSSGNGSDEPVHILLVKLYRMSDPTKRMPEPSTSTFSPPQSTEERRFIKDSGGLPWLLVSRFTDAQSYSWERLPNGTLRVIEGSPATRRS
jgi:hypothetical protein